MMDVMERRKEIYSLLNGKKLVGYLLNMNIDQAYSAV
jgi:hypothetical protein